MGPVDVVGGLVWCTPIVGAMFVTVALTDRIPELLEIKHLLQSTLLPVLRRMPGWVNTYSVQRADS